MELQHQQSCVLPGGPVFEDSFGDGCSSQHRGVLRGRSANRSHDYHLNTTTPVLKLSSSPSPTENAYTQRAVASGAYYTGHVYAQHIGLAGFGVERPEKQIRYELEELYKLLERSDKYQKYREKQPFLTTAEVIAREAAERQEKAKRAAEHRTADKKDNTVWPEFLEHAFWKALVRWPPMGRKKFLLDGDLRGRNELIQDSIFRDTGISRDRKQVSSHLQVLKAHLKDQPAVLVYMATREDDTKRHRGSASSHAYHLSHLRGRPSSQRTGAVAKFDFNASSPNPWPQFGAPHADLSLGTGFNGELSSSPFTITEFTMLVDGNNEPLHYLTRLQSSGRFDDMNVTDIDSWRRLYPEFNFLQPRVDEWRRQNRKVLVCDASIRVLTEARPNAHLVITFDLHSQYDLSGYKSLEYWTRFYDSGDIAPDPQFDSTNQDSKEHCMPCTYEHDHQSSTGQLRIGLGSPFWVMRMAKYRHLRRKDENCVRDSLLRLTATQDVYGKKPGSTEKQCLFTVLWRFQQTKSSAEVGSMTWRAVNFTNCQTAMEQKWIQEEDHMAASMEALDDGSEEAFDNLKPLNSGIPHYQQSGQLPLDYQSHHNSYEVQHHRDDHPPPLSLDILASMQPDLELTSASAPTTATDYSQQSFSSLSQNQNTIVTNAHGNNYHFNGGHITINGNFEPPVNLSAYDSFASQSADLDGLHALPGLEHDGLAELGLTVSEDGQLVNVRDHNDMQHPVDSACYSTKPSWHHSNLISCLENAAEQYHPYIGHDNHSQATQGHEVLHNHGVYQQANSGEELISHGLHDPHVNVNHSLWSLQSPFHEDTGSGAVNGVDCRRESVHSLGLGVLDLIERDPRARGY